nr:Zinc finger, CCHC-type [Ipomoea batatas]
MTSKFFHLVSTYAPDSDDTICISTEKCGSISTPAQAGAEYDLPYIKYNKWVKLLIPSNNIKVQDASSISAVNSEIHNNALAFQIPNLNAGLSSSTEPNDSIFASASAQRAIRRHSNGVHVACVASKSGTELAVGQIPDFDGSIPRPRNNGGLESAGAEANTRNPFVVTIGVLNSVLALTQSVPQLDGAVTGRRHNLAVINGEGNRQHVLGVANEPAGCGTGLKVPEAELTVPGAGESKLAVGRENHVLNKVGVAGEAAAGHAELRAVLSQAPHDD